MGIKMLQTSPLGQRSQKETLIPSAKLRLSSPADFPPRTASRKKHEEDDRCVRLSGHDTTSPKTNQAIFRPGGRHLPAPGTQPFPIVPNDIPGYEVKSRTLVRRRIDPEGLVREGSLFAA